MEHPDPGPAATTSAGDGPEGRSEPHPLRVVVPGVGWPLETFVERLLTGLAARGVDLTLLSAARPDTGWLEDHGIRWAFGPQALTGRTLVDQVRRNGPRAAGEALTTALGDRVRRRGAREGSSAPPLDGFDVLYAPWINVLTDHPHLLAAGPPVVTSCRGSLITIAPWNPDRGAFRAALRGVFTAAHVVHCVSDAIVSDAAGLGLDPGRARVVRPGVDAADFSPRGPAAPRGGGLRAVACGTLHWTKDHETTLTALRRALDRGADLTLDLIGEGPGRTQLLFAIDDLDLSERVRLLGRLPAAEVARRLRDADLFVHTSSSEGISNAVLEAMATGLAVVTTDAGGMREAVRDGIDGLVVPVRGAEATADALVRLAADPDLRDRLGASARRRVAGEFRLDQQVAAFADLLHEAAGR